MSHACIICKKDRAGRFTRRKFGASGAWTKDSLPAWFCWACLPPGDGRDEDEDTMTKKPTATKIIDVGAPAPAALMADKREGLALQGPLHSAVEALGAIQTSADYAQADSIFGRIKQARKTWNTKWYGTKDKLGPIPSLRGALDQLYAINREIDKPLQLMEEQVERGMKAFKLEERRQLQAAENERLSREQALRDEAARLAERKDAVKTTAAKNRIEGQIEQAEIALTDLQLTPQPEATKAANSSDRAKKVVTVADLTAFIKGAAAGTIPEDCLTVNMVKLRAYYKDEPAAVEMFPGVVIEDDIQIVGR